MGVEAPTAVRVVFDPGGEEATLEVVMSQRGQRIEHLPAEVAMEIAEEVAARLLVTIEFVGAPPELAERAGGNAPSKPRAEAFALRPARP